MSVNSNASLISLSGLNILASIGDSLSVHDNASLTSLSGLDNIAPLTISPSSFLIISGNPLLSICDAPFVCAYLKGNGKYDIKNNAPGCNDRPEIEAACNITEPGCLRGGISFYSQVEIDSFTIKYPGCINILGNIIIKEMSLATSQIFLAYHKSTPLVEP